MHNWQRMNILNSMAALRARVGGIMVIKLQLALEKPINSLKIEMDRKACIFKTV